MTAPFADTASRSRVAPADARPIAVLVDREGLGDALMKLPMLRAIARAYPGRPIWWIAMHQTAMGEELAPWVKPMIARVLSHACPTAPPRAMIGWLRTLPRFELVLDTRTRVASVLMARAFLHHDDGFFACLPGYALSTRRPPGRWRRPRNNALRALSLAQAAIGAGADWRGTLEVGAAAQVLAGERLPPGPRYVGLAPGSREARKNWPIARFIDLAQRLSAASARPVFMIGPQERDWLAMLRAAVPMAAFPEAEPVDPARGVTRLEFAIALGQRLDAVVANDSGFGHLMAAIATPIVSLFGPSDAARWHPFTPTGVVIRAQEFGGTTMAAIPVEPVMRALEVMLRARGADQS
ncbi:MAG: glycosyltransferase family 9 protein [Proteobacteria bacterium]|nr:glycosyltransferase family 9 protein [Pseudomonadota bacterium]